MQWPYRSGTQTLWMREREIERAYRDRFDRRRSDEETLKAATDHLIDQLDLEAGPWLVGVARPMIPIESYGFSPQKQDIQQIVNEAIAGYPPYLDHVDERLGRGTLSRLGDSKQSPRVGLRRWVLDDSHYDPQARSTWVHAEVHHDGTVTVAQCSNWEGTQVPGRQTVVDFIFNSVIIDLLNLFQVNATRQGLTGGSLVRLDLARRDSEPFAFSTSHQVGRHLIGYRQPSGSRDVRRFIPVETALPPLPTFLERARSAYLLATDSLSQFGVRPEAMGWQRPPDKSPAQGA